MINVMSTMEMLKWRPLLQQAQGEHRLRHRTPQQAGYPGPICLGQLSDWQDHLIYDSSQLQDLITQSKDVNPPPVPISLLAHCVQTETLLIVNSQQVKNKNDQNMIKIRGG